MNMNAETREESARSHLVAVAHHSGFEQELSELSAREIEILSLLSTGIPYKQAACVLGLAHGTLKNHVHNIISKLRARNLVEAIHLARTAGLL